MGGDPITVRRFFAPGKVVLVGEYAVLDGAPAVVAAVDRGVCCEVTAADACTWSTPSGDDRFVAEALTAVGGPAGHFAFSDHRPPNLSTKAGLGGSAAAATCAVLAGATLAGSPLTPAALRRIASRVHHAVQGSGSGIDVAAASHGGVIAVHGGRVRRMPERAPTVVFSGRSASTGPRVATYLAWQHRLPFVAASTEVVDLFSTHPVDALREATTLLSHMADQTGLSYWTPGLLTLVDLASQCGGAAKPSGAGGGDVVVALFDDDEQDALFRARATDAGFQVIPTSVSPGAEEWHG